MTIYLDHHATTPVDPRVLEVMLPYFREQCGNASSINHEFGWRTAQAIEVAREQITSLLQATGYSIVFTSGATEANNLAIKGVLWSSPPGSHVIASAIEHPAVLDPLKRLKRRGYDFTLIPVDRFGHVHIEDIAAAVRPQTVLVSIMWANNEIGTIQKMAQIADFCAERRIPLHTDAAQAVGKIPIALDATPVSLLSLSGHKFYAPQGIGALLIRDTAPPLRLEPLFDGGGHQKRLRSGTLPVPLIAGMGAAADLARSVLPVEGTRLAELSARLYQGISSAIPGVSLNGPPLTEGTPDGNSDTHRLPGNVHLSFEGVDGTALLSSLREIAVSSGSACTTENPEPSHVLRAINVSESLSLSSLRFGLGRDTTPDQIDFAIDYVAESVGRLRG